MKMANTYSPYNGEKETIHRDPKEILKEIEGGEKDLQKNLAQLKEKL